MYKAIDFFEPLGRGEARLHGRGQLWWACVPQVLQEPYVSRFYWKDHQVKQTSVREFDPKLEMRDPGAKIKKDEFVAITKFGLRPVVILSTCGDAYRDRAWRGGECYLVAPMFTLRDRRTGEWKCNPDFAWEVITYRFSSLFYVPRCPSLGIKESVVHLDRMVTLHRSWLLGPCKARLHADAMKCLNAWLYNHAHGRIGQNFMRELRTYREIMDEDPKTRTTVLAAI